MNKLIGKRLLILGGPAMACDIVKKAKEMGIYTIVTDWYKPENSPAKLIADEYSMVSTSDIDALIELINSRHIDGVFTSFIDSTLPFIQKLCEKINLPFYATKEQLKITLNKNRFKKMCKDNDVPVVKEFDPNKPLVFPVVVKPIDSSGSKGISICYNKEEFEIAYNKALLFSNAKEIIVEKLMDNNKPNINLDYVFCDGIPYLSAVGDLYSYSFDKKITPITSAVFYPSVKTKEYVDVLDKKVKEMFIKNDFKNGFMYIQSFYDEEGFHFYESGYRLGGGQSYVMIEKMNGVNHLEMLINYSLTGKMCNNELLGKISPFFDKSSCGLSLILKEGKITRIDGLDKILKIKEVVNFLQILDVGNEVLDEDLGTVKQLFGKVHIVGKDRSTVEEVIEYIFSNLVIQNEAGENILLISYNRD